MAVFYDCLTTYAREIPRCVENIVVNLGLDVGETYNWTLTSALGVVYGGVAIANEDGEFTIPTSMLPPELLNPWAGTFIFQLFIGDSDQCNAVPINICQQGYQAIAIRVTNAQYLNPSINIACSCP
jgi:hypothetical protein